MMFFFHAMFSWELIALVAGVFLLVFVKMQDKVKKGWPIFVSWVVIVIAALSLICSVFFTIRYWSLGYDRYHTMMMERRMMYDQQREMQQDRQQMQEDESKMQQDMHRMDKNGRIPDHHY